MIIIGTSGASKELLTVFSQLNQNDLIFFNDTEDSIPKVFSDNFRIIKSIPDLILEFKTNNQFVLGIGNPNKRRKLDLELSELGGIHSGLISPFSKYFVGNSKTASTNFFSYAQKKTYHKRTQEF